ncbi:hypothetical protein ACOBV8_06195 [Pseudoalteromonas espejiana]
MKKLDGVISRTDQTDWSQTNFTSIESDELEYTLTNDETLGLALFRCRSKK